MAPLIVCVACHQTPSITVEGLAPNNEASIDTYFSKQTGTINKQNQEKNRTVAHVFAWI
jgi:hypothetical protein